MLESLCKQNAGVGRPYTNPQLNWRGICIYLKNAHVSWTKILTDKKGHDNHL